MCVNVFKGGEKIYSSLLSVWSGIFVCCVEFNMFLQFKSSVFFWSEYCVVWIFYSTVSGCHCCSDTVHVWKTISLCVSPKIEGRPVSLYNALIGDCMRACLWLTWARKYKVQNKRGMYAWWRRARDEKIRNTEQNINRETRCTRCQSEAADEGACNIERRRYKNKKIIIIGEAKKTTTKTNIVNGKRWGQLIVAGQKLANTTHSLTHCLAWPGQQLSSSVDVLRFTPFSLFGLVQSNNSIANHDDRVKGVLLYWIVS